MGRVKNSPVDLNSASNFRNSTPVAQKAETPCRKGSALEALRDDCTITAVFTAPGPLGLNLAQSGQYVVICGDKGSDSTVEQGSAAQQAGLQLGDIFVAIQKHNVEGKNVHEMKQVIGKHQERPLTMAFRRLPDPAAPRTEAAEPQQQSEVQPRVPADIILWDAIGGTCPFVQSTRIALEEKGVPYTLRDEFDIRYPQGCEELAVKWRDAFGSKMKPNIPLLEHGDVMLPHPYVICEYIAEAVPGHALMPTDPVRKGIVRLMKFVFDNNLGRHGIGGVHACLQVGTHPSLIAHSLVVTCCAGQESW